MYVPVAIHKEDGSVFGVTVPDIPGCHSWGDSINEAVINTKEAIKSHIETLLELGEKVDIQPSTIDDLIGKDEFAGATWLLVDVDENMLDPTPERVNISLPRFLLHRIDEYTAAHRETRSGFLAKAAMKELAHE